MTITDVNLRMLVSEYTQKYIEKPLITTVEMWTSVLEKADAVISLLIMFEEILSVWLTESSFGLFSLRLWANTMWVTEDDHYANIILLKTSAFFTGQPGPQGPPIMSQPAPYSPGMLS